MSEVCKKHHVLLGDGIVDVDLVLLVEVEVPGVGLPVHTGHDGGSQGPGVDVRPVSPGKIPEIIMLIKHSFLLIKGVSEKLSKDKIDKG